MAPALCAASSSGVLFSANTNPDPTDAMWGWYSVGEVKPKDATIDTLADRRDVSGWSIDLKRQAVPQEGVDLVVVFDLAKESHTSENRAGFTIALTTAEGKSVVVNVWESKVWLVGHEPMTKRADAADLKGSGRHEIKLEKAAGEAAVSVDGQLVGRVPLRDFSTIAGVPSGYLEKGSLFIGDASTAAGCQATLQSVTWRTRGIDVEAVRAVLSTLLAVAAGGGLLSALLKRKPRERQVGRVFIDRH